MACVGYAKRRVRRMILESSANVEAQTVMSTALQKVDSFTAPLVQTQYTQFIILVIFVFDRAELGLHRVVHMGHHFMS